jgi:hypothetical protein
MCTGGRCGRRWPGWPAIGPYEAVIDGWRDGRVGRDPAQVTPEGHSPILETRDCAQPIEVDDRLMRSDGTEVVVVGVDELLRPGSWEQIGHVGNVF